MDVKGTKFVLFLALFIFLYIILSHAGNETDSLQQGHQLKDGEFLVSANKVFILGFCTPISMKSKNVGYFRQELSRNRYLGIWYNDSDYERPVWIANRNKPIPSRSGSLVIDSDGVLKILQDGNVLIVLSSNRASNQTSIVLMDTGNLALNEMNSDGSRGRVLWQSFDYPTDTLLPGMRVGFRFGAELNHTWSITSWVSDEVPATGSFTLGADPNGTGQLIIWKRGEVYWKSGNWNHGIFENFQDYTYRFGYKSNKYERFFTLSVIDDWRITSPLFMINKLGMLHKLDVEPQRQSRLPMASLVDCHHQTISFGFWVGEYPKRFMSPGCIGSELPECHRKQSLGFVLGYVVFDGIKYSQNHSSSIADCESLCLSKCSCVAYASLYNNGTACELWSNRTHIKFDSNGYREFYVLEDVPQDFMGPSRRQLWWLCAVIGASSSPLIFLLAWTCRFKWRNSNVVLKLIWRNANVVLKLLFYFLLRKVRAIGRHLNDEGTSFVELGTTASHAARFRRKRRLKILYYKSHGLQFFALEDLSQATDEFSPSNKLGQGGFGTVYKGKLQGGQEVAIKRLSRSSKQGLTEFKNELKVLANLQHTNLVKIVGCCVERGEKLIVYEYMPNKSLDSFISDPDRKMYLDWKKRFHIIEGIAQGLLYLHKYSRLKIIHRDLKAANILLDEDLNAKISDFGMARIFGEDESQANTSKIAGTYGYMPPEYVMVGTYSEKSDMFSFGVLLIEIVSGKKNNAAYCSDRPLNLIGHAWELWMENRGLELIDEALDAGYCDKKQAMRCIHVGLLCAQEQPSDRPSMSDVIAMISNESIQLGPPNRPAFFFRRNPMTEMNRICEDLEQGSVNDASISDMVAR